MLCSKVHTKFIYQVPHISQFGVQGSMLESEIAIGLSRGAPFIANVALHGLRSLVCKAWGTVRH